MFIDCILTKWTIIPLAICVALTVIFFIIHFGSLKKRDKLELKSDAIRGPTNSAITVSGVLVPLVCALIAYLVKEGVPKTAFAPFVGAILFLLLSIATGLWNLFSLTSANSQDILEIKKDFCASLIPMFVLQLLLLFAALFVLALHFLITFQLPTANAQTSPTTDSVFIARHHPIVGMSASDLRGAWGIPESESKITNGVELTYTALKSHFRIVIKADVVEAIHEERK